MSEDIVTGLILNSEWKGSRPRSNKEQIEWIIILISTGNAWEFRWKLWGLLRPMKREILKPLGPHTPRDSIIPSAPLSPLLCVNEN